MNILKSSLVALCVIASSGVSFSQNSSKVYVGQSTEKIYYSVYVNPVVLETLDVKLAKDYLQNGDYANGDLIKIPVQVGSDRNGHSVYAQIIGQVSSDYLTGINDKVYTESKKRFGADKVENWPENLLQRNLWGIKYNEKAIDSKYYIISTLKGFTPRIDLAELGEGSTIPASDGLICFAITDGTDINSFKVEQLSDFTTSSFTLLLKNKIKTGKKGKNAAKESHNDLTRENKTVTKIISMDIKTTSEDRKESILEAYKMFFKPEIKDELINNSNKFLEENISSTIEKFFLEVDENL